MSGTDLGDPQVIVMRIDDTVGADVDPALDGLLVVLNASPDTVTQRVPGLEGAALEPVAGAGRGRRRRRAVRPLGRQVRDGHRAAADGRGLRPAVRRGGGSVGEGS